MPIELPELDAIRLDGRCYTYVLPCAWEDFCKIGFSRDPLGRIRTLHPRWFEFFDLATGVLVEAESERDARDLELALRRPLKAHRAPAPLTIPVSAGGKTEWVRGAQRQVSDAVSRLGEQGYRSYPLGRWLQAALHARLDRLYSWSEAQLPPGEEERTVDSPALRALRDWLDAHVALGIDPRPHLPAHVRAWYDRVR
ncbi:GIY-YIG nuclease family protein [Stenotrophomonas sp. HITSZ_GD]|uniref:GIY-YIG nuclease family protein n=1 Tax=Stenotrophomonas sp. HITSZ_GD TaxID=3037248 RepID=UPI00240D6BC0|nr:GIY-YIG nuclease family protein [Stenotrophomonas sp. HITSZ_GD]MDG2526092.1 GIY-YIG nuclease family protein [Stenotrophomonas sp. HITSZ_GD]